MRILKRMVSASSKARANWDYDVLVVGGGVVGGTLVARLSKNLPGARIGIVESKAPIPLKQCQEAALPDIRVYALSPTSIDILKDIGVWSSIQPRAQPYDSMQVWDARSVGLINFDASELGASYLGAICENSTLQSSLWEFIQSQPTVDVITSKPITHIHPSTSEGLGTGPVNVTFNDGSKITTRLIVGADGANSLVRKHMSVSAYGWDYGQRAIVATVQLPHTNTCAHQRFLPTGPLALLPLWDTMASIVWSTTPQQCSELQQLAPAEFVERLNEALQQPPLCLSNLRTYSQHPLWKEPQLLLDALTSSMSLSTKPWKAPPPVTKVLSPLASFPLRYEHVSNYVEARFALAGDAAHTIHPMAGQGLNLGILDADALSSVLEKGFKAGADLGDLSLLRKYDTLRRRKNMTMLSSLDMLHRVYGTPNPGLGLMRGLGMLGINSLGLVKNSMARVAMGVGV